jgi:signal transduction histidine kinase
MSDMLVRGGTREARPGQVQEVDRTLSSLERISRALTVTTEGVSVLLQTVADTVAEVFDCPFVFLVVRSGERELCAIHPRRDPDAPGGGRPFPGAWCITEQTLLQTGPMRVACQASDGCPCEFPRNLITVPMSRDGVLQGAIALHTSGDSDLDEYNSSVLQVLANQATVAVQNARLFEESQELRRRAEDLYRVAIDQKQAAERKRRQLEMAQDEIAAMEREQIVSDERERIARELHDDVAQILASIGLNVEWCRQQLPVDSLLQERLSCLKQLARDGLYEIRHTLLGLSPTTVTELGLAGALEKLVDDFQRISRISTAIEVSGQARPSENGNASALYHICQEALYNVFKHARASQVEVRVAFEPDAVQVTVIDDGIGFAPDVESQVPVVTFGLRNMKARAEELGGQVSIERAGDRGTRVAARIPE